MFENNDYIRIVLTAYWNNTSPSTEVFYLCDEHFDHNGTFIADLEQKVLERLQANCGTMPLRVIYITHCEIDLSDDDVALAGWRVLVDTTEFDPVFTA
jgi:hypothetical protein